jgi:hypothetical protein
MMTAIAADPARAIPARLCKCLGPGDADVPTKK